MSEDQEMERFKMNVAKFAEQYGHFLVVVRTPEGRLIWKTNDPTWGVGAARRYLSCTDERDREEERNQIDQEE